MLTFPHDQNTLELSGDDAGTSYQPATLRWLDNETDRNPTWDIERTATGRLRVYNHETNTQTAWFGTDDTLHVQSLSIEAESAVDAGSLDGLDSSQFARRDVDETITAALNVTGTLSQAGNDVLTTADEGELDAGSLAGNALGDVRQSVTDNGMAVNSAPEALDYGQYLQVSDNGDGTVTIDSLGGNAVGSTATATGDGAATSFTVSHELGMTPASVDVTPRTEAAMADHYVTNTSDTSLDVVYASAPADGASLEWHVTAFGSDGSGTHAVSVADDTTTVALADHLNFGAGLDVTDNDNDEVTIDAAVDTAVSASDDGTEVLAEASGFDFSSNLAVSDNGDGTVTVDGTDTYPSVSADGSQVLAAPGDLNFANNLSVVDDSDGSVTIHATDQSDADTLDGHDSGQFLRSDVQDSHTDTLGVTFLAAAPGNDEIHLTHPVSLNTDDGLRHETSGSAHRLRPRREGLQGLANGGSLPTDYGMTIEADATVAFLETDNDRVAGWLNTNQSSMTLNGGVRVGDHGGDPQAALDVRGSAQFNGNELHGAAIETRTNDPNSPAAGQMWLRTDLL